MKMGLIGAAIAAAAAAMMSMPALAAVSITGLYDTGVDNAGHVLGSGVADTHYVLNNGGTPTTYNNGAYVQSSDSTYIAANSSGGYSQNPNTYTLSFSLAGLDASTASISGLFAADNHASVFLNGTQIGHTDTFTSFTSFSATSGFVSGINTLSFTVTDDGPPSALNVSALKGTASAAAVPEPATWAMMIGGFGMIGMGLRRNRKVSILFG